MKFFLSLFITLAIFLPMSASAISLSTGPSGTSFSISGIVSSVKSFIGGIGKKSPPPASKKKNVKTTPIISTNSVVTSKNPCEAGKSGLCNPLRATSIQQLLVVILSYLVKIGTVFIVLMIVFVGFKFAAAQGNAGELEKVRTMFIWTIVGALIILGAQAISMGISSTISAISQIQ